MRRQYEINTKLVVSEPFTLFTGQDLHPVHIPAGSCWVVSQKDDYPDSGCTWYELTPAPGNNIDSACQAWNDEGNEFVDRHFTRCN